MLAFVIGVSLTKTLCTYFEKRTLMIALTVGNAITMAVFYVIPPDQYWLMLGVHCIGSLIIGPTPAIVWAMYADTADYGEWKTGRRTTGLVFSSVLFAQKMGLAVGAGLAGVILGWFGFVANEAQSETSLAGIRFLFSVFPAILSILSAAAIIFYTINKATIATFEKELAERHAT
jgi:GPH family glycoside/pentoside/hexuronide:cation symporter